MARIDQLTPEEEALIPIVRDEWLKIGLATGPADRQVAQTAIADAYGQAGLKPPKRWIWVGSPWAGCIAAKMLRQLPVARTSVRAYAVGARKWEQVADQVGKEAGEQVGKQVGMQVLKQVRDQVRDQVADHVIKQVAAQVWNPALKKVGAQVRAQAWDHVGNEVLKQIWDQVRVQGAPEMWEQVDGQVLRQLWDLGGSLRWETGHGPYDVGRLATHDMFRRMKRVKGPERLEPLMRVAAVAGWWWPFAGACIITERPTVLHRDQAGSLHCDSGPALAYPDSWSIHAWHGLCIPAWLVEDKARITPHAIEAEANAELRRVMLEIFGFDKYIEARGARLIAEDACLGLPRQLFEIDLAGETIRVLRVVNGTVEADGRRRQFHLGVPLECNTPHEAVAWSYGRPAELYTEAVRT